MAKTSTKTEVIEPTVTEAKTIVPFTPEQLEAEVKRAGTVSALFRELTAKGMTRGEVAKLTGKRYQHVRNVLITPVKKVQG